MANEKIAARVLVLSVSSVPARILFNVATLAMTTSMAYGRLHGLGKTKTGGSLAEGLTLSEVWQRAAPVPKTFTPSEVKIIEMLTSIQVSQRFTLERLDKINGSVARHEKELREQGIFLEGQRHDFQALREEVRRHTEVLAVHETALQQSRGVWRAAVIVAGIVSAVETAVGSWVGR